MTFFDRLLTFLDRLLVLAIRFFFAMSVVSTLGPQLSGWQRAGTALLLAVIPTVK